MTDTSSLRRAAAVWGLVLAAVLSAAWTALAPAFPSGSAERLAAIETGGTGALVSAALFAASQLPMLVAVLAVARLAAHAPRLAVAGAALGVLGTFGHAVFGGISLTMVVMARDVAHRDVHAAVVESIEGEPAIMLFAVAGLLGTVLGILVLSIALWRSRAVPRWIPALLWVFLVVEFVGVNLSDYAAYVSSACLVLAFGALALEVRRSPRSLWRAGAATEAAGAAPALVR